MKIRIYSGPDYELKYLKDYLKDVIDKKQNSSKVLSNLLSNLVERRLLSLYELQQIVEDNSEIELD